MMLSSPSVQPGALLPPVLALTSGFVFAEETGSLDKDAFPLEIQQPVVAKPVLDFDGTQYRQGFLAGGMHLMVGYDAASELVDMPEVFHMPNTPLWFLGMASLHGLIIPVIDLAEYIGTQNVSNGKKMLLVLGHGQNAVGLVTEGLPERLNWSANDASINPDSAPERLLPHVTAACFIDNVLWFDIDYGSLLDHIEMSLQQH